MNLNSLSRLGKFIERERRHIDSLARRSSAVAGSLVLFKTLIYWVAFAGINTHSMAALNAEAKFEADEAVESIEVRIAVDSKGEPLAEPVSLDLGLGFPFWLYPLGHEEGQPPLYGAVPSLTNAKAKLQPGQKVIFTFQNGGEKGLDLLLTSQQLLDGVKVSDISQIGFASRGDGAWALGSYEILINGKPFASMDAIGLDVSVEQKKAQQRLAEIAPIIAPLEAEATPIASLIEAGLAMPEDEELLKDIGEKLIPLLKEKQRLERQIAGGYPWFVDPDFKSPWRGEVLAQGIGEVRVTVLTASHTGAETKNHVYFQTGGHKYLLSSPLNPLEPMDGPQVFPLDLVGAPLTAADLRGYSLGMLASGEPSGDAPDRWHPQRLMVEIDGRVVYDSDEVALDRLSMESIRVVPPAHLKAAGEIVANVPNLRETFAWKAGQGMGIDLVNGGAAALPDVADPAFPEPEAGLGDGFDLVVDDGFDPAFPPFPGEGWIPGWMPDPWSPPPPPLLGWWVSPPGWLDVLSGVLDFLAPLFPGIEPFPIGDPPQVTAVRMEMPPFAAGNFTIRWDVTGNEALVHHYAVQILPMFPDRVAPIVFSPLAEELNVPVGTREWTLPLSALPDPVAEQPFAYLLPVVTAVPIPAAPGLGPEPEVGPARPFLFTGSGPTQPTLSPDFISALVGGPVPVSLTGDPGGPASAVWIAGEVSSHRGLLFDEASPGLNVGIRVAAGDELLLGFKSPMEGKRILSGYLGFEGGPEVANNIETENIGFLYKGGIPAFQYPPAPPPLPAFVASNPGGGPALPMTRLEMSEAIDTVVQSGGAGLCELEFYVFAKGGGTHPDFPCILYGTRLFKP